jgi:hypothetical protein
MNNTSSFNDYLSFLRESIQNLAEYWQMIGHDNPHIKDISAGLNHKDPFIIYKASIAATLLLEDRSIYH